jgi:membrane-associated phospholipid phosphatase
MAALVAVVTLVLVYLCFVRTRIGQELDDGAFEGRNAVRPRATHATDRLLGSITRSSLVLLGGGLVLIALVRLRWRTAVCVAIAMTGAIVTSEVLKHDVLTRPAYRGIQGLSNNSFPSGHATIAMSLALGLVMVAPRSLRLAGAIVGALFAMAVGTGVLASGWHRPSDSLGAFLVTFTWFCVMTAVLVGWRGTGAGPDDEASPLAVGVTAVALLAAGAVALFRTVDRSDDLVAVHLRQGYVLAGLAITALGVLVVATYVLLLAGASLDPHRRPFWRGSSGSCPAAPRQNVI